LVPTKLAGIEPGCGCGKEGVQPGALTLLRPEALAFFIEKAGRGRSWPELTQLTSQRCFAGKDAWNIAKSSEGVIDFLR
jgi:hypothetical protein